MCDESGAAIADGTLGDTPWQGTSALFWTEVELVAPMTEGVVSRSVRFAAEDVDAPHTGSASAFTFATMRPPEHCVTVSVVEKETRAPIERAEVRLGPYRGTTDEDGLAKVETPKGTYEVCAWKPGYLTPSKTLEVTADETIELEGEVIIRDDPWSQMI